MPAARGARADLVQGILNIVKDDVDARREGSSGCSSSVALRTASSSRTSSRRIGWVRPKASI